MKKLLIIVLVSLAAMSAKSQILNVSKYIRLNGGFIQIDTAKNGTWMTLATRNYVDLNIAAAINSVSYTNGYGLKKTGTTFSVDTFAIASFNRVRKITDSLSSNKKVSVDSLATVMNTALALKQNAATAEVLANKKTAGSLGSSTTIYPAEGIVKTYVDSALGTLAGGFDGNNYPTSLSFNTGTGVVTLPRNGLTDLTVDLDGRWLLSSALPAGLSGFANDVGYFTSSNAYRKGQIDSFFAGTAAITGYSAANNAAAYNDKIVSAAFTGTTTKTLTLTQQDGGTVTATFNDNEGVSGTGINSLNGMTGSTQTFATGSTGTDVNVASSSDVHTINVPTIGSGGATRGLVTSAMYATWNAKQAALSGTGFVKISGTTISYDNAIYLTANQSITFAPTGDVTGSASGATSLTPTLTIGAGKVTNSMLAGSIAYSKLTLTGSIVNADVSASAAIAYSKLSLTNSIVAGDLTAGSVTVAKISATGTPSSTTYLRGDGTWSTPAGGGGSNTMSNVNTAGVGVYNSTTGSNFDMKGIAAGSAKITVTNNTTNKTIDIGINESALAVPLGNVTSANNGQVPYIAGGVLTSSALWKYTGTGWEMNGTTVQPYVFTEYKNTTTGVSMANFTVGVGVGEMYLDYNAGAGGAFNIRSTVGSGSAVASFSGTTGTMYLKSIDDDVLTDRIMVVNNGTVGKVNSIAQSLVTGLSTTLAGKADTASNWFRASDFSGANTEAGPISLNTTITTLTDGATITANGSLGSNFKVTLAGTGRTLAITNAKAGQKYTFYITQDGTGSRTITTWPTPIKWRGAAAPTLTTTASRTDIVEITTDGTNYFGDYSLNYN